MPYDFSELKVQLNKSVSEHNEKQSLDGFLYNGSVIAAILCSSIASQFVDKFPDWAKILSVAAAIIIAIDRALNWGGRWIYHRQMRHEYLRILDRINLAENSEDKFTPDEAHKYFVLIFDDLFALRSIHFTNPILPVCNCLVILRQQFVYPVNLIVFYFG
jgi:hypothetical protein